VLGSEQKFLHQPQPPTVLDPESGGGSSSCLFPMGVKGFQPLLLFCLQEAALMMEAGQRLGKTSRARHLLSVYYEPNSCAI
jgi:hypothetical protein